MYSYFTPFFCFPVFQLIYKPVIICHFIISQINRFKPKFITQVLKSVYVFSILSCNNIPRTPIPQIIAFGVYCNYKIFFHIITPIKAYLSIFLILFDTMRATWSFIKHTNGNMSFRFQYWNTDTLFISFNHL